MRRGESMFDVDPSIHDEIAEGIETDGSNLCGISANCSWKDNNTGTFAINTIFIFIIFDFHSLFIKHFRRSNIKYSVS